MHAHTHTHTHTCLTRVHIYIVVLHTHVHLTSVHSGRYYIHTSVIIVHIHTQYICLLCVHTHTQIHMHTHAHTHTHTRNTHTQGRIQIMDFNPYSPMTDPLLFSWEELKGGPKSLGTSVSSSSFLVRTSISLFSYSCYQRRWAKWITVFQNCRGGFFRVCFRLAKPQTP